jgi:3-hydroxyacyl-CoA dehydrogenase/enoyl-CoA hydratase/3-hydroxybutyryl-CoA epimerase
LLDAALKWIRKPRIRPRRRWPGFDRIAAAIAKPVAGRRVEEKSRGHYPAPTLALNVVTNGVRESIEDSLRRERAAVLQLAATPECRNLLRVFQLQERAKKLRIPGVDKPAPIEHVAVIGAGVMGAAIAQWLSARGLRILMRDIDPERVAAGMERVSKLYADAVKHHLMDRKEARDAMDRISTAATETPLNSIDLVIEAAVEKMDLKKRIFLRLDDVAPENTILATNTSALSITDLAASVNRPDRIAGIHFFNPVHRMPLVEVITGAHTSPQTAAAALRFVQKIGKMPVLVRDSPGFLVNRILLPYLVEAGELFARGAAASEIDDAMLDFGMPMGPLRLIDEVGLDVAEDVAATLAAAFPGHMHTPAILGRMLSAGMLGKKNGRGFYLYNKGKTLPNPAAVLHREPGAPVTPSQAAMQRRMTLLMLNEAARCIQEKVVAEPADADFGMIMGAGFAPFRGGPLRHADTLGSAAVVAALRDEEARQGAPCFAPCELLIEMSQTNRTFYANH